MRRRKSAAGKKKKAKVWFDSLGAASLLIQSGSSGGGRTGEGRGRWERTSHTLGRPREAPRDAFTSETPERADARSSRRTDPQRTQRPPASQPLPAVSAGPGPGPGRGLHGPAWINSRGFTRTAQREWRDRAARSRSECVRFSPSRHVFPDLPHAGNRPALTRVSPHSRRFGGVGNFLADLAAPVPPWARAESAA